MTLHAGACQETHVNTKSIESHISVVFDEFSSNPEKIDPRRVGHVATVDAHNLIWPAAMDFR
jgi:hypothetical protein